MTIDEVQSLVRAQSVDFLSTANDHRINLEQALISPHRIQVIFRSVTNGCVKDAILDVWLVGQESTPGGYKIVMRDDGKQFGLASVGFPYDKHPILCGWYGSLVSAFHGM